MTMTRENVIAGKALAIALEALSRIPKDWQPQGDMADMKTALDLCGPDLANFWRGEARDLLESGAIITGEIEPGTAEYRERENLRQIAARHGLKLLTAHYQNALLILSTSESMNDSVGAFHSFAELRTHLHRLAPHNFELRSAPGGNDRTDALN